jgi:hypothetical protein
MVRVLNYLNMLYSTSDISMKLVIGKAERKEPPGRPACRWEDIRMDLREIGWQVMD